MRDFGRVVFGYMYLSLRGVFIVKLVIGWIGFYFILGEIEAELWRFLLNVVLRELVSRWLSCFFLIVA